MKLRWRINHHPSPSGCRLLFNGARVSRPTRANRKTSEAEERERQRRLPPAVSSALKVGTLGHCSVNDGGKFPHRCPDLRTLSFPVEWSGILLAHSKRVLAGEAICKHPHTSGEWSSRPLGSRSTTRRLAFPSPRAKAGEAGSRAGGAGGRARGPPSSALRALRAGAAACGCPPCPHPAEPPPPCSARGLRAMASPR